MSNQILMQLGLCVVRFVAALLLLVTLLPLLGTGQWFVRVWDFPRLQLLFLLLAMIVVTALVSFYHRQTIEFRIWFSVLLCAAFWQASHLLPFTPLWSPQVPTAELQTTELQKTEETSVRILVVNLKFENRKIDEVANVIDEHQPDVVLLIEIDRKWFDGLGRLKRQFAYQENVVEEDGLGMCLWSRLPLSNVQKRYLVSERRVSIWATLATEFGAMKFVGVHPTPPGLKDKTGEKRRDSRVRDAELVLVAREVQDDSNGVWVVAGDFNDVAWSHTTRLFQRLSGMGDPRVGRNFLGTFHSEYPILRMPIDHVFLSKGFSLMHMDRVYIPGSDHFGVSVEVKRDVQESDQVPETKGDDQQEAQEMVEQGKEDAAERNVDDNG